MTYSAYIERQIAIIRSRHEFDEDRINQSYSADTERLFDELLSMNGLNVAERGERAQRV